MKNYKNLTVWSLRIALMCILLNVTPCFGSPLLYGNQKSEANTTVPLKGGPWSPTSTRSLSPALPTATIDGTTLIIENSSENCDITISIYDSESASMYEQTIPASATGYITIPLNGYPSGTYLLYLTNPSGGYLYGYFTIN